MFPFVLLWSLAVPYLAFGAIPVAIEPQYFKAVQTFQRKDFATAIQTLDRIIAISPETFEPKELKALCLLAVRINN